MHLVDYTRDGFDVIVTLEDKDKKEYEEVILSSELEKFVAQQDMAQEDVCPWDFLVDNYNQVVEQYVNCM